MNITRKPRTPIRRATRTFLLMLAIFGSIAIAICVAIIDMIDSPVEVEITISISTIFVIVIAFAAALRRYGRQKRVWVRYIEQQEYNLRATAPTHSSAINSGVEPSLHP